MLVYVADDELRQCLQREGIQPLEALQEERCDRLVMRDNVHRVRTAAEARVVLQRKCDSLGQTLYNRVHIHMCDLQLRSAVAFKKPIDEHEGSQIGAHPAVFPEPLQNRHGRRGHHLHHAEDIVEPGTVVHHGVLYTAPFTPLGHAGLVIIAVALSACALLRLLQRIEALQRFVQGCDHLVQKLHVTFLPGSV